MNKIAVFLTSLVVFCATTWGQMLSTADSDFKDNGTKYMVVWTVTQYVVLDRPNTYGQFPVYQFNKDYSQIFATKAEAGAFISSFDTARLSTGTFSVVGVPKIKEVITADSK